MSAPDGTAATPAAQPAPAKARTAAFRAVARASQAPSTDPLLPDQWPLAADQSLHAPAAWARSAGEGVTIAVLDTGVDLGHPDLQGALWTNPDEVAGNGRDDDRNGYVDDVHGADVVDGDGDPADRNGHGTHVAGIIAARAGNGVGVSGLAGRSQLMVVRVLDARAGGDTGKVAAGIRYAIAEGAKVINLSLSGPASSGELDEAVDEAERAGVLIVSAAGNTGKDLGLVPSYPASLPDPNVVAVAASDSGGALARLSAFGRGVDVAAPGQEVLSTAMGGGYEWRTGTSMASPHVAATLALLLAARPDLSADALRTAVVGTAQRTGLPVEAGSVDAAGALSSVLGPAPASAPATKKAKPKKKAKKKKKKAKASKKKSSKKKKARKSSRSKRRTKR